MNHEYKKCVSRKCKNTDIIIDFKHHLCRECFVRKIREKQIRVYTQLVID